MIFSFDFYAVADWKKTITKLIPTFIWCGGRTPYWQIHFDCNSAHRNFAWRCENRLQWRLNVKFSNIDNPTADTRPYEYDTIRYDTRVERELKSWMWSA